MTTACSSMATRPGFLTLEEKSISKLPDVITEEECKKGGSVGGAGVGGGREREG